MRALVLLTSAGVLFAQPATHVYSFGFLKSAPGRVALPKEEMAELQKAHLAHLGSMGKKGALVAAGPLINGGVLRGVIIFKTPVAESMAMASDDPMVQKKQLVPELYQWRAPAGIGEEYARVRVNSSGAPDKMIRLQLVLVKQGDVEELRKSGKVRVAGPVQSPADFRAIAILNAASLDEAKSLVAAVNGMSADVLEWMVADGVIP